MFVVILWVHDSLRHRGIGTRLMELAEEKARERGCQYAYLDTFSFQACPFYKRLGYEVFGTLDDFPNGHKRYFMKKSLHTFQGGNHEHSHRIEDKGYPCDVRNTREP
jgi:ribosomal protein S18 acetylase RimI-like enzyme